MHKFTDGCVFNPGKSFLWSDDLHKLVDVVMIDVLNEDTGGVSCAALTKEDLLHLLKLIEEIN